MEYLPIDLQAKKIFDRCLSGFRKTLATYCFSSFYLWRNWERYRWTIVADALIISGADGYCLPIAAHSDDLCRAVETLIARSRRQNTPLLFTDVTENNVLLLQKAFPDAFAIQECRDGANYIYEKKDMLTLSGKKYHSKRNYLHRFFRAYPDYMPGNADDYLPACRNLLEKWFSGRQQSHSAYGEYISCLDCLEHLKELDCTGTVLLAEGRAVAFSIGEMLDHDTWLVHFEKADTDIPGAYQAINWLSATKLPEGCLYINRAEDMGIEGLRQAKISYHPCRMEKEFRLRLL